MTTLEVPKALHRGESELPFVNLGDGTELQLLQVDVDVTEQGHRVRFTGGTIEGVRVVHLDVVCIRDDDAVGLLWFADTPEPFPTEDVDSVVERIYAR